eukprot:CAMPEP_0169394224 /NCGR_PEP_ID=MMETSP1017-20121227/49877_1 /TAXON_ID=342587 /ORGANISM="Karlodinium micrum, Strain CCMP2283" /LENGTH=46 /DNA_ID= /DNA_START= /DNA_END= /DNA_ORIENTATION=
MSAVLDESNHAEADWFWLVSAEALPEACGGGGGTRRRSGSGPKEAD